MLEGTVIPAGSLVAGVPAKVRRVLTDDERAGILRNAQTYLAHVARHASAEQIPDAATPAAGEGAGA